MMLAAEVDALQNERHHHGLIYPWNTPVLPCRNLRPKPSLWLGFKPTRAPHDLLNQPTKYATILAQTTIIIAHRRIAYIIKHRERSPTTLILLKISSMASLAQCMLEFKRVHTFSTQIGVTLVIRKIIISIVTLGVIILSFITVMTVQEGQAQARALCVEQAEEALAETEALLAGKQRKITLESIDEFLDNLNQARSCMTRKQRLKTREFSNRLGIERAILLFEQPNCTNFDIPIAGCTPDGWPKHKRVPRNRLVKNPGF